MMGKSKKRKPTGYWEDIENLKKEILPLCENIGGMPTAGEMEANGIFFSKKLHKELGGFPGLTKMLGFEKRPGNQAKPITIFGEVFPSRLAAAEHYKINLQTFRGRLRKGWTPEDAATKTVASDVTIEVDGLSFPSITALATHYKVGYKLVHGRIRTYKWAAKEAVTLPKKIGRTILLNGKKYPSIAAAAIATGVAQATAVYRISVGWTLEKVFDPNAEVDNRKSVVIDDECFETSSIAARNFAIKENTFTKRIRSGWSPEQAAGLIPPPENKGGKLPISAEEYRDRLYEIHGDALDFSESEFQKAQDPIHVKCNSKKVHPVFRATPNNLLRGKGCSICKLSMGAKRTARWLEQRNFFYEVEWTGHGLRSKKDKRGALRCDFYLPDHKVIIEFDGQQHFEPIRFGNQTEEEAITAYHVGVENDERKNKWAKENDHHMIRIRYDELVSEVLSNDEVLSNAIMNA
jgi:very-short-patch-repair endonuclease